MGKNKGKGKETAHSSTPAYPSQWSKWDWVEVKTGQYRYGCYRLVGKDKYDYHFMDQDDNAASQSIETGSSSGYSVLQSTDSSSSSSGSIPQPRQETVAVYGQTSPNPSSNSRTSQNNTTAQGKEALPMQGRVTEIRTSEFLNIARKARNPTAFLENSEMVSKFSNIPFCLQSANFIAVVLKLYSYNKPSRLLKPEILLQDVTPRMLFGSISNQIGVRYLSPVEDRGNGRNSSNLITGILTQNESRRIMIPLPTSPTHGRKRSYNVIFLLDTGAPCTLLSQEVWDRLELNNRRTNRYGEVVDKVKIRGVEIHVEKAEENSKFAGINLLGQNSLEKMESTALNFFWTEDRVELIFDREYDPIKDRFRRR